MVNNLLEQLNSYEKELCRMLVFISNTKINLLGAYNMYNNTRNEEDKTVYIPYAAFEEQAIRFQEEKQQLMQFHKEEKDAMREHYRNIVKWVSVSLVAFIIAVFGTVIWFFNNYDLATYTQDAECGNTNFIGNDGDISNGEANYYPWSSEAPTEQGSGN